MKEKGIVKNILTVVSGNGIYLISNILLGLVLPLILDVKDYGYYKIYTLYVGYCGLLHFGFVDGILLRYGGCEYSQLNKPLFRTYTRFFFLIEAACALLVVGISMCLKQEYRLIIACVGLNLIWCNVTLYYQYISQATSRFKEFSLRKMLQAIGIILALLTVYFIKKYCAQSSISYLLFILLMQTISFVLLLWYVYTYRDITFGPSAPFKVVWGDIKSVLKKGIMLTVAYEVAQLIMIMDRQFVSLLFDVEVYAKYAFTYNILSCVTALITAVSTVMFPMLKKTNRKVVEEHFEGMSAAVLCLVGLSMVGVYALEWIIGWILPEYIESMTYIWVVFPALMFISGITIVGFTYYKVFDKIKDYLIISVIVLVVAFFCNCIAICIWNTPTALSVASVFVSFVWYVAVTAFLARSCHLKWGKGLIYAAVIVLAFYCTAFAEMQSWQKILLYLIVYLLATLIVFRNTLVFSSREHA